jgi:leucyl aminopeptidase
MGGASAVIGALITASELKLPVNIITILPITDNAVSEKAYLPSDVVTAYNGKTIEVLDTDAEGKNDFGRRTFLSIKKLQNRCSDRFGNAHWKLGQNVWLHLRCIFSNNDELKKSWNNQQTKPINVFGICRFGIFGKMISLRMLQILRTFR